MPNDDAKKSAQQLLITFGLIECAGWTLVVLPIVKVVEGPMALVVLALGIVLVVACLAGVVWTAIQLARIQGGK